MSNSSSAHIIQSLIVNILITLAKGVAAFMTKSGAMLAETIHSFADCANQGLLLLGVKQSEKPANSKHPLGYGREIYFWSFMVAMLLFSIGGMFSIYEGIHKFENPEPVKNVEWGIGILLLSLILEGYATYSNIIEINKRRKTKGFFQFIKTTKDSDLVVIFGENSAAVFGLSLAIIALLAAYYKDDGRYDALGSFAIGIVLIAVAIFLAREVKSLLIGESADDEITVSTKKIIENHSEIIQLINIITIQEGPGKVLICLKIKCKPNLNAIEISNMINSFEKDIRATHPEVKWIYIEPDLQEWKNNNLV